MSQLPPLTSAATMAELFPARTALTPKTTAERMRWVGFDDFRLDAASGFPLPVLGNMPLVCHRNTLTANISRFFDIAGIRLEGRHLLYDTYEEAVALARQCHDEGYRLAYFYPPPSDIASDHHLLISASLYDWLNDKSNIDTLCAMEHLPPHRHFSTAEIDALADYLPGQPVYVKVCHPGVSGGGADVLYCPDQAARTATLEWLATRPADWTGVRAETALDIHSSWCLNVAVGEWGVRYLGAATQLFSEPARQSGSRVDPADQPSTASINVAMDIARKASGHGFVGIAGFDIGETSDGKPFVFDLNFRLAACTEQILLHESATQRIGGKVSQSWGMLLPGPLDPALQRIEKFAQSGQFVPLRLYDRTPAAGDISRINGMLIGNNPQEIEALQLTLQSLLADLASDS